jgi:seryl-tRNA synthetase
MRTTRMLRSSNSTWARGLSHRLSATGKSLDLALLAAEPDLVISHLRARRSPETIFQEVSRIGALRVSRSAQIVQGNESKSKRNALSQAIGKLMKEGRVADDPEIARLKQQVAEASAVAAACDSNLVDIDAEIQKVLLCLPNLLHEEVPDGIDDSQNVEVRNWGGEVRKMGPEGAYKWHDELAVGLGGLDMHAAAKMSGARFSVLLGPLARMERALMSFCIDFHASRGYTEVSVPFIVSRSALVSTGQLPKFEADLFKVNHSMAGEDAFLIPTAEVPVTNIYREQILEAAQLPVRHVCGSPSFRAEAGSHGRDTRGLLRQHQFHKVELVKIVSPETSDQEHMQMIKDAEGILEALGLPYRTVLLCSGDTGFSAHKCYDIEVWLPGQQIYKEISSVSNCHDFQARRMALRYRPLPPSERVKGAKTTAYPHTINGSGLAIGRTLVAILENYQLPDGSVAIPEALRPYMGGQHLLAAVTK